MQVGELMALFFWFVIIPGQFVSSYLWYPIALLLDYDDAIEMLKNTPEWVYYVYYFFSVVIGLLIWMLPFVGLYLLF